LEVTPVLGRAGDRLPCGADIDDLFEQVADGRPPTDPAHQQSCPHCRAALPEIANLWEPVQALAAEHITAPPGLLSRVMTRIRALAQDAWHGVLVGDRGLTRIGARVVGSIARMAAARVPGVGLAIARGRTVTSEEEAAEERSRGASRVGVAGSRTVLELDIVIRYGSDARVLAERVRETVIADVTALTGLTVKTVDITVADIT
jgi:uncharacterized alkaline shock family protein YloU